MTTICKSDLYRLGKSKLFYAVAGFACLFAFALSVLTWQDIRLGISVFGNLTIFKSVSDIIKIGIQYHKALGILVAVIVSVFIGQEYVWNTWQHKWMIHKSRTQIYLSKAILSALVSTAIFVLFEIVTLICCGQINDLPTNGYLAMMIGGVFMYAALGSVICMFSMLIKNNTASTIVCIIYILFSETMASVIRNIGNLTDMTANVSEWLVNHSIYGMSTRICDAAFSFESVPPILINSIAIILLSTVLGIVVFRKYEV